LLLTVCQGKGNGAEPTMYAALAVECTGSMKGKGYFNLVNVKFVSMLRKKLLFM